jgi:Fic family protein
MLQARPAPTLDEILRSDAIRAALPRIVEARVGPLVGGDYLHWDELRHRPTPVGLTVQQWWAGIKIARANGVRAFPLRSADGRPFTYSLPDPVLETLHWLDQHSAGEVVVTETIKDAGDRRRYLVSSLFEEAITSSQLEGASATRQVAKEMLRSGRPPRDRGERMILNNYRAMSALRGILPAPLTPDGILRLHAILTEGTLHNPEAAGRLQRPDEERVDVTDPEGTVVHVPPPAEELPARLAEMCAFANGDGFDGFIHPVVRAILLHLWLAYDHPFEDGNGRTARALFYREMLAQGYWLFEYVTISRLLVRAPAQYARAFLYTETDEFDATYFVLHQLQVIRRAVEELMVYLQRKMAQTRETIQLLKRADLNHRQVALLTHALRHPDAFYTIQSHATSHGVVHQSARTDLLNLVGRGLLERQVVGRRFIFRPAEDLARKLAAP